VIEFSAAQLASGGSVTPAKTLIGAATLLSSPMGIAIDSSNKMYVTNETGKEVLIFAAGASGNTAPVATITGSNTGFSTYIEGIAVDSSANVYVADYSNSRIAIWSAGTTGNVAPTSTISGAATGLSNPRGLMIDPSGNIYVTNNGASTITIYSAGSTGNASPSATISGSNTGLTTTSYFMAYWAATPTPTPTPTPTATRTPTPTPTPPLVLDCSQFPGVTPDAQINACIAASSAGGAVNASKVNCALGGGPVATVYIPYGLNFVPPACDYKNVGPALHDGLFFLALDFPNNTTVSGASGTIFHCNITSSESPNFLTVRGCVIDQAASSGSSALLKIGESGLGTFAGSARSIQITGVAFKGDSTVVSMIQNNALTNDFTLIDWDTFLPANTSGSYNGPTGCAYIDNNTTGSGEVLNQEFSHNYLWAGTCGFLIQKPTGNTYQVDNNIFHGDLGGLSHGVVTVPISAAGNPASGNGMIWGNTTTIIPEVANQAAYTLNGGFDFIQNHCENDNAGLLASPNGIACLSYCNNEGSFYGGDEIHGNSFSGGYGNTGNAFPDYAIAQCPASNPPVSGFRSAANIHNNLIQSVAVAGTHLVPVAEVPAGTIYENNQFLAGAGSTATELDNTVDWVRGTLYAPMGIFSTWETFQREADIIGDRFGNDFLFLGQQPAVATEYSWEIGLGINEGISHCIEFVQSLAPNGRAMNTATAATICQNGLVNTPIGVAGTLEPGNFTSISSNQGIPGTYACWWGNGGTYGNPILGSCPGPTPSITPTPTPTPSPTPSRTPTPTPTPTPGPPTPTPTASPTPIASPTPQP